MKNKRLLISLLCMAIFVVTIIGLTIFAILYKHDEYEIHNISITGYGYRNNDSVDLDFGNIK